MDQNKMECKICGKSKKAEECLQCKINICNDCLKQCKKCKDNVCMFCDNYRASGICKKCHQSVEKYKDIIHIGEFKFLKSVNINSSKGRKAKTLEKYVIKLCNGNNKDAANIYTWIWERIKYATDTEKKVSKSIIYDIYFPKIKKGYVIMGENIIGNITESSVISDHSLFKSRASSFNHIRKLGNQCVNSVDPIHNFCQLTKARVSFKKLGIYVPENIDLTTVRFEETYETCDGNSYKLYTAKTIKGTKCHFPNPAIPLTQTSDISEICDRGKILIKQRFCD